MFRMLRSSPRFVAIAATCGTQRYFYAAIQGERSIFWDGIVLAIVGKNVHMNMCLILNDYVDKAVWIHKCKSIVNEDKQRKIAYC